MLVSRAVTLIVLLSVLAAVPAAAVVEPKTGTQYPDRITVETPAGPATLVATGAGLREKTVMKVDVYTIVSYVPAEAALGAAPAAAIMALDAPKRLQMDLRRGFSRAKLVGAFVESIEQNYADRSAFAADLETFLAYFQRDAQKDDCIVFTHVPGVGLTTSLNGEVKGVIENFAFTQALWSVWFGEHPVDGQLARALVAQAGR
jgi:hypothetical protein